MHSKSNPSQMHSPAISGHPPVQRIGVGQKPDNPSQLPLEATDICGDPTPFTHSPHPICDNQHFNLNSSQQPMSSFEPHQKLYPCLIPGCSKYFTRSDYRRNHLKRKHHLPLPKRCWAHIWILKPQNRHYYWTAIAEQTQENNTLLPYAL